MKTALKKLLWAALAAVPAVPAAAAITQTFNYQGFLVSRATGQAVDGSADIRFVLFDAASGGTARFTESRCDVPVRKGRYDAEIGSATAGGIPVSVISSYPELWLEIQVDPDGDCAGLYDSLSPRVRLQATPYAFSALYASTAAAAAPVFLADTVAALPGTAAGGITVSTHLFTGGALTVGSSGANRSAVIWGNVESKAGGFVFPDGSVQTQAAGASFWVPGAQGDMYSNNPGNIGISTGIPQARLHISSGAGASGDMLLVSTGSSNLFRVDSQGRVYGARYSGDGAGLWNVTGTDPTKLLKGGDTMTGFLALAGSSLTVTGADSFAYSLAVTTDPARSAIHFAVSTRGFVGAGTVSPSHPLQAWRPGGYSGPILAVSTGTSDMFTVSGDGEVRASRFYGDGSNLANVTGTDAARVSRFGDTMTGQLTMQASSLTVAGADFTVGGSAGIGTDALTHRLTVDGGILAVSSVTARGGLFAEGIWVSTVSALEATLQRGLTASSSTLLASGLSQYSLETASGVLVGAGGVTAPFFSGDGSRLTSVTGTDPSRVLRAGDRMTGHLEVSGASVAVRSGSSHLYSLTVTTATDPGVYHIAVSTGGNAGFGVADPAARLHVRGEAVIGSPVSGEAAALRLRPSAGDAFVRWDEPGTPAKGALGMAAGSRDLVYRASASDLSTGVEALRVKADGRIGFGPSDPIVAMHSTRDLLITEPSLSPILFVSTASGRVSVGSMFPTHKLYVVGGIMATSSVTASGGFYGDGSNLTNIAAAALPAVLDVSTLTARAGNLNGGLFLSSNVFVAGRFGLGTVSPSLDAHIKGQLLLDQKASGDPVFLRLRPGLAGASYIQWDEAGASNQKGVLGFASGSGDLVYRSSASALSNGTEVFRIRPDGRFGVGVTPSEKMHFGVNVLFSEASVGPVMYVSTTSRRVAIAGLNPQAELDMYGSFIASGTYNFGAVTIPVTGAGVRMLWLPEIGAFRAGGVGGTQWDSPGRYSAALGYNTKAGGVYSAALGGWDNTADGDNSVVAGGYNNKTTNFYSTISGGLNNLNNGDSATIGGGGENIVTGTYSTVPGGRRLVVHSSYSFVGGYNMQLNTDARNTFVWGYSAGVTQIDLPDLFLVDPGEFGIKAGFGTKAPQTKLEVNGDAQFGSGVAKTTFTAQGFWQPRWLTSAEIGGLTPSNSGQVVGNSDIGDLCLSTGTARGAWAIAGSRGAGNCY